MARTIGIDLGTTNSVIAFLDGSRVETIPNAEGSRLTPSCVFYKSGDEIIVGGFAKRQFLLDPDRCVRSIKRIMGKRSDEYGTGNEALPYTVAALDDGMAGVELGGGILLRPEEVSADILERLRETAEDFLGEEINQTVITVPAHFNDQQRTATKAAAEMAGLEVLRIINEPTAAALAYGFGGDHSGTVAVFDFGGGTFDVSILQISGDIFEVLATNGDNHLGGDDIDQVLFEYLCDGIVENTGIDPREQTMAVQRVREAAEKAKCELSTLKSTTISLPFVVADEAGPKHFETILTRDQFNSMMDHLFQRLFEPCRIAMEDANIRISDIDEVLLVGGSTRISRVQEMVTEFFSRPPNHSINPDEAVALGAAIQSGVITGALREVLLLDVTPLTLGIELAGGVFKPLIQRNSTIPCEAKDRFTTVVDNQTSVVVHALQGERKKASENHSLAKFRLVGIPPAPKELPEVEVHFNIDANGILSVTAIDMTSGQQTGVVVENYGDIGTRREIVEKIVAGAAEHEEEDEEFVRFAARRQKAERLQDRANKLIDALGELVTAEHMKILKESSLRLDLAMEDQEERLMLEHEERIQEVLTHYEENQEFARILARNLTSQHDDDLQSLDSHIIDAQPGAAVRILDETTATRRNQKGRPTTTFESDFDHIHPATTPPPVEPISVTPLPTSEPPPPSSAANRPVPRGPWSPAPNAARGLWPPRPQQAAEPEPEPEPPQPRYSVPEVEQDVSDEVSDFDLDAVPPPPPQT